MLKELLLKNRSYRRFVQDVRISREELTELVGLTRYCASGRNAQALKYKVVADVDLCDKVFPNLAWAGYLKDWDGPEEGERPAAYLIQLLDTSIVENCLCDDGIQAQAILLGAVEKGYASAYGVRKVAVVAKSADELYDRLCEKWEYCDYELVSIIKDKGEFYAFLQSKKIKTYYE